jgi:hypothetical protein
VGKTVGRSTEQQGRQWWWVDQGGCLDPMETGPYGGSRVTRKEKTAGRRNRELAHPPVQARWKKTDVLGLGFIPNRHKKKQIKKKYQAAIRSGAGKAQRGPK